jgi:hypothetical protein
MADVPPVNGNGRVVINMGPWTGWIAAILAVAALIWNQATWKTTVEHDVKDLKDAQPSVLKLVETSNEVIRASNEERKQFLNILDKLLPEEPVATPRRAVRQRQGPKRQSRDMKADGLGVSPPPGG